MLNFVLAEGQILPITNISPSEQNGNVVDQNQVNLHQQQDRTNRLIQNSLFLLSMIISIVISIFITRWMIKKSFRLPHLILYGLVFIGVVIYLLYILFSGNLQYLYLDPLEEAWSILLLIPTSLLLYGLIRKENFEKKWKYSLNLFFGGIIFILSGLVLLAFFGFIGGLLFVGNETSEFSLGFAFVAAFLLPLVGTIASLILGIVGFFIDLSAHRNTK
jgi:hypothetical protein